MKTKKSALSTTLTNGFTNATHAGTISNIENTNTMYIYDTALTTKKQEVNYQSIKKEVLSMYARGISSVDISNTIDKEYNIQMDCSAIDSDYCEMLSNLETWQYKFLDSNYIFILGDSISVTFSNTYDTKKYIVYMLFGYTIHGKKEILGVWIKTYKDNNHWLEIFKEIKIRGVEDIVFVSLDNVSKAKQIQDLFPNLTVQEHALQQTKYARKILPNYLYHEYVTSINTICKCSSYNSYYSKAKSFIEQWKKFPELINTWIFDFTYIRSLYAHGYTIESILKSTTIMETMSYAMKGSIKNSHTLDQHTLLQLLYLEIQDINTTCTSNSLSNWSMIIQQMLTNPKCKKKLEIFMN